MEVFEDRADAGRRLGQVLAAHSEVRAADRVVVLGVPRGGLPVGAEVAAALGAPLDVVVVRKLRSALNPELELGAVSADGHVEVDREVVERLGLTEEQIAAEIADRQTAIGQRLALFREVAPPVDLVDALVVVVDDGVVSGETARLACAYARRAGAGKVLFAVPVAPSGVAQSLGGEADEVIVLSTPAEFIAVGQAYVDYAPLDDETAVAALRRAVARA